MATEKTLKTRLKMKHGKESEWTLATRFIPLEGEIIVYDVDDDHTSPRFKVGDGTTNVNNLKFVNQDEFVKITTLSNELATLTSTVDGITVGGTNLLPKSKYSSLVTDFSTNSHSGYGYKIAPSTVVCAIASDTLVLEPDTEYTLSFTAWIYASDASWGQAMKVDLYTDDLPEKSYPWNSAGITNKVQRFAWTFSSSSENMKSCKLRFFFSSPAQSGEYVKFDTYITDIKLEKGNKPTDWSPAPEDIESRMSAAELKITSDAIVSTVTSSESYTALSNTASTAKANAATAQSTADEAKSAAATNAGSITALNTAISQKADSVTVTALQTQVNGITVGGTNLYTGTQYFDGSAAWKDIANWTEDGTYNGCKALRHVGQWQGLGHAVSLEASTQYTLSAWMKQTDGGRVLYYDTYDNNGNQSDKSGTEVAVGTSWSRCHVVFTTSESGVYCPRFEQTVAAKSLWVAGMKLEKGNKPTDWSPAPEDLVPTTRTINSKALSSNITLTASDVGALSSTAIIPATQGGTGCASLSASANALINSLSTGSTTPSDADYFISQYVGGGTSTTTYLRRPVSALWNYIKNKGDNTYLSLTGGTLTNRLTLSSSLYPSLYLTPTYNNGTNGAVLEGSYQGAVSLAAWDDISSNTNRRMIEVRNATYQSSLDNAVVLRNVVDGSYYSYRIFHTGMATPVPVANGGTGSTTAVGALTNLGIIYSSTEPAAATGKIWLKPV